MMERDPEGRAASDEDRLDPTTMALGRIGGSAALAAAHAYYTAFGVVDFLASRGLISKAEALKHIEAYVSQRADAIRDLAASIIGAVRESDGPGESGAPPPP